MTKSFLAKNITISYGKNIIVQNLSFEVPPGTIISVMGPNGGGKTTFLKALIGLIPSTSGQWGIKNDDSFRPLCPGDVGYLAQGFDVPLSFPITVQQMVGMALKKPCESAIRSVLEQVNLLSCLSQPLAHLSGGQLRRAFFARTLLQDTPLMFLDEPFAGLDQQATENLMHLIQKSATQGKIIFLAHHNKARAQDHSPLTLLLASPNHLWGPTSEVLSHDLWESSLSSHPLCC